MKIVHLAAGALALLLSLISSLGNDSLPYLQQADAVYLTLFGLLNLLLAPFIHDGEGQKAQSLVSVLLILSVVLQALVLLLPLEQVGNQPGVLLGLVAAGAAVLLQLFFNLKGTASRPATEPKRTLPRAASTSMAPRRDTSDREAGTVKWFNTSKGFGFIARDSGEDIFVHFRAIRGEGHRVLIEGQRVEFTVMQRDKGLQAEDVVVASPARH